MTNIAARRDIPMKLARSYEFEARTPDVSLMLSMPGLDYLRGILSGHHPGAPISATLSFFPVEFDHGRAVFEGTPERFAYNPLGMVHGGWAATILDSALGCAVHSTLPAGKYYTTVELSVSLVRAITEKTKRVRCEATIVHVGSTVATAEAKLVDDRGQLCAHGTTTCLIMSPR
jgi:uncharacterized protein (TIGR00369 family)